MKNSFWPLLFVAIIAAVGGFAWYVQTQKTAPQALTTPPPAPAAAPAPPPADHYPVESTQAPAKPLPPLNASDGEMRRSLAELLGEKALDQFFPLKDLIRRIVATVDNLPREHVSSRLMALKAVPGHFAVSSADGGLSINPENYSRYAPYVHLVEAVDVKKLVALYAHLYPLFQQAYVELGFPDGYFNDRLVAVIDNLLATPRLEGTVRLLQPNLMYQYSDPRLESLSAGQKILLRMGPENAAAVEAKLRELRTEVTSGVVKR
jgi:hypothetical protein